MGMAESVIVHYKVDRSGSRQNRARATVLFIAHFGGGRAGVAGRALLKARQVGMVLITIEGDISLGSMN